MLRAWLLLLLLAACDRVFGSAPPAVPFDAPTDAPMWSTPVQELAFHAPLADDPSLTGDLKEIYYNFEDDIWMAERDAQDAPWGNHRVVVEVSSSAEETTPEVVANGLTLVVASAAAGTQGDLDVLVATRPGRGLAWSDTMFLTAVSSSARDSSPSMTMDQREIVFASTRTNDKVWTARSDDNVTWTIPEPLAAVNTINGAASPLLRADGLAVCFNSYLAATGAADLYIATRESRAEAFSTPVPIDELNTLDAEEDCWLSPDGHHIYFMRRSLTDGSAMLMHSTR